MASKLRWCQTIHPTKEGISPEMAHGGIASETSVYEKAKEVYEEAKEAYEMALQDLANAHTEAEKTREAMVKAREAFLVALGDDKIEEES